MDGFKIELTALAALVEISPGAIRKAFPDLRPHDDPVPPADIFNLIVHW